MAPPPYPAIEKCGRLLTQLFGYNLKMSNPKGNEYGQKPQYTVGDRVRIWPIHRNPIGTIEKIVDAESFPIKYLIRYEYFAGGWYTEQFDEGDLTLYERIYTYNCNCQTGSERHATWCNRYNTPHRW